MTTTATVLSEQMPYLKESMQLILSTHEGEPLDVELPTAVEMDVIEAEPAVAGNTATGALKKVKVETGLELQVPLFIEVGDTIRVDTRTGEYVTRV